jgi:hypothetical protein
MNRDLVFWATVAGTLILPSFATGVVRGRRVTIVYAALTKDMKQSGHEPTPAQARDLLNQLLKNPEKVLESESDREIREIKRRHIQPSLPFLKNMRRLSWLMRAIGIIFVVSFQKYGPR